MKEILVNSIYFGFFLSIFAYFIGIFIKNKTKIRLFNPLFVSIVLVILILQVFHIDYKSYEEGAKYISYFLTPATICLAIPLYKQLKLLENNWLAVSLGILSGVITSLGSIFVMAKLFRLDNRLYVTMLPKSITTAIGMGVSEELGGIVTITVAVIIVTGILGNIIADGIFHTFKITHPIAKGLSLGTCAHAIGTARALEMGEIEGAMSSLSIAVAGIITVIVAPIMAGWI